MLCNWVIGLSVILTFWLVQYHWKRRKLYRAAAQFKGPFALPLIGNTLQLAGDNTKTLNNAIAIMAKYKSPIPIWLGHQLLFAVTDAKNLQIVLNHPHALEKSYIYQFISQCIGNGLFSAPVPLWKKHRKIIAPTFNQKILDGFVEVFSEQSIVLVSQLEKFAGKGTFDVFSFFGLYALDSICETAMGISINAQTTDADFVKWTNRAMELVFQRMLNIVLHVQFIFNLTNMSKVLYKNCEKIKEFTTTVIKQKKKAFLQAKTNPEAAVDEDRRKKVSFLEQFITISKAGEYLTDEEIRDEVITIMIGGSDTTASVNSFVLIMLGMHPEVQEKVYQEVIEVIGQDRPIEFTDLPKLAYTELVIKETMRLFPVGPMIVRELTGDIILEDNSVLPAGSDVVICSIHAHRDPEVWPDPMKFDPLRFLPEECAKRHPYSYLPFSGGPRNCIGLKYAMMSIKTVIASLIRRYKFETPYKCCAEIKIKQDLVIKPTDGYNVSIERRAYID